MCDAVDNDKKSLILPVIRNALKAAEDSPADSVIYSGMDGRIVKNR